MSNVIVENRHDTLVNGRMQFGDVLTVAGAPLAKGESREHSALAGRVPERASIDLEVFSGATHQDAGRIAKHVHSEIDVRKQVPPGLFEAAFYFIIEQDFSLRLVVMSIDDYQAMKARHERPK